MERSSATVSSTVPRMEASAAVGSVVGVRAGIEGVDLSAQVDECLQGPVVELLCDVAPFLFLSEDHLVGVGLEQIVPSGFGSDVLEDDLHAPVGAQRPHEGDCRPEEDRLTVHVERNRRHPLLGLGVRVPTVVGGSHVETLSPSFGRYVIGQEFAEDDGRGFGADHIDQSSSGRARSTVHAEGTSGGTIRLDHESIGVDDENR